MMAQRLLCTLLLVLAISTTLCAEDMPAPLTPPAPAVPRINGPAVFGARPGSPVLYSIPATGDRPMSFTIDGLPAGLAVDASTGRITGTLADKGEFAVTLHAKNEKGEAEKKFRIVIGDRIALTPPMGWSSWNCWGDTIDQDKILRAAKAMDSTGLSQHGFTYINMDDGWQGNRTGPDHALAGNEKFPDMPGLVKDIHNLGLKAGIYSTPWETSYAKYPGGSAETADGEWHKLGWKFGKICFAQQDARQWASWGIDYLKYDWPIDVERAKVMSDALHASGRDMVFSLSNNGSVADADAYGKVAECWRTTSDIYDQWRDGDPDWHYSVSEIGFSQDPWAPHAGPGHWNDPDMLVVGQLGWGTHVKPTRLTPDQQYSHISLWCMLSAPLILGCDLEKLDPFTLGLLTNDEVLAIDQDELGQQAIRVATNGPLDYYLKPLADGSKALAIFNRSELPTKAPMKKLFYLGFRGKLHARDLWQQKDLPKFDKSTSFNLPADGVVLLRVWTVN
jgi:alpha-galactosidase